MKVVYILLIMGQAADGSFTRVQAALPNITFRDCMLRAESINAGQNHKFLEHMASCMPVWKDRNNGDTE